MPQPQLQSVERSLLGTQAPPLQPGESTYTREYPGGDAVRFTITPATVGAGGGWIMHLFFAGAISMFVATISNSPAPLFILTPILFLIFRAVRRNNVTAERGAGGSFTADRAGISWGDYHAAREDITGFAIKPTIDHKTNESVARGWKVQRLRDTSWQLILEYAGRSAVLAGGMTEHTARGLMSDVRGLLNSI